MTEAPDFRSDPSESPEGRGIAHGRRTTFWRSVPRKTLAALSAESPYVSIEEWPAFVRDHAAEAVVEDAELIGFWVSWHRAGGFQALESGGWHRATIYRKIRRFRARFGAHPDEYRFGWITLDLERAWNEEIDEVLQPFSPPASD
jgi:hypothetical protein